MRARYFSVRIQVTRFLRSQHKYHSVVITIQIERCYTNEGRPIYLSCFTRSVALHVLCVHLSFSLCQFSKRSSKRNRRFRSETDVRQITSLMAGLWLSYVLVGGKDRERIVLAIYRNSRDLPSHREIPRSYPDDLAFGSYTCDCTYTRSLITRSWTSL